jgi:hypothetical protein
VSATTLGELASIVRSKNAGPFRLTVDVFFDSPADYRRAVESGAFTEASVCEAYGLDPSAILGIYEMEELLAVKVSFERPTPAGSREDSDVYGAQQHGPMADLAVD